MNRLLTSLVFLMILLFSSTFCAADGGSITGLWWNQEKSAQIEIYPSGDLFFGKITFLKEPVYPPEDALGLRDQPNRPGTTTEYPNWRRRYPGDAGSMLDEETVAARLADFDARRRVA